MSGVRLLADPAALRAALGDRATALDDLTTVLRAEPARLATLFPAAARRTARGPLPASATRTEDAVRVELVAAAASALDPASLQAELLALYRFGDGDEKRAVLLALGGVDDPAVDGTEVLLDALRTNDTRLVAAAMGPHASRLTDHDWRHGVLKCLFVGVPLAGVADLTARADDELVAMVRRFAAEREAAGRAVPDDATTLLDRPSRKA